MLNVSQTSILLADNSHTFLTYAGILLKRLGFQTYLANDAVEAIRIAKEKKPTIIVLDYVMPKMDGISCLSVIRNDPGLEKTPVIVLTAQEKIEEEFESLGCCYFLKKPVNVSEFHNALRVCLGDNNKRKFLRTPVKLRSIIQMKDEKRELFATSISEEGMFLRTAAPYEVGTMVDIAIFNLDGDDPVELQGKVIYSSRLSTEIEEEPGMGIIFTEIPEDVRLRLGYYVMKEIVEDLCTESRELYNEGGTEERLL